MQQTSELKRFQIYTTGNFKFQVDAVSYSDAGRYLEFIGADGAELTQYKIAVTHVVAIEDWGAVKSIERVLPDAIPQSMSFG